MKDFKQDLSFVATLLVWTVAVAYVLQCAYDMTVIFLTLDTTDILGASMLFTPSFSVSPLVTKSRKFGESNKGRLFCGLHTPAYRVLNHVTKALLDAKLFDACVVMISRGYHKHISHKSHFSVTISHGYSSVTIGARQIFAVDEHTRTIYHIDSTGRLRVTDYHQGYDMTDVIAQVSEAIEVLADCYVAPVVERVKEEPIWWTLKRVMLDRPYHGPIKGRSVSVVAKYLRSSKKEVRWCVEWMDKNNPSKTKIEKGGWHTAYKVEIDGVVAWLPHSILGGLHNSPFTWNNRKACRLDVPEWWVRKNIADKLELPF
jgi:hypothetical protein